MRITSGKWWLGFAVAVLCIAPSALADTSITLTGAGNNPVDGIYVGPYYATVNGVANTPVICDDFADEVYLNESWGAISPSPTIANPTGALFASQAKFRPGIQRDGVPRGAAVRSVSERSNVQR